MSPRFTAPLLAIATAVASSCVSSSDYGQVRGQLKVEQDRIEEEIAARKRSEAVADVLTKKLRLIELQRDKAREYLELARTSLPVVVQDDPPVSAAGTGEVLAGTIFFRSGKIDLSAEDRARLKQIANEIAAKSPERIIVSGHSDPAPIGKSTYKSNMHISSVRALAVYHELVGMAGIDISKVEVRAFAEYSPASDGSRKRRVEIWYAASPSGAE